MKKPSKYAKKVAARDGKHMMPGGKMMSDKKMESMHEKAPPKKK